MSAATKDYGELLRDAIVKAKTRAPKAEDDLIKFASRAAAAVQAVTGGEAWLELKPIRRGEALVGIPNFQMQLHRIGSNAPPSDLGVYSVSPGGYPVLRWYGRSEFEDHPDNPQKTFPDPAALEGHFDWLVSDPDSRLVSLVAFFQQLAANRQR